MGTSRGDNISGYYPNFGGTSGIKVYKDNLKAQVISGTIISANVAYAVNHQLGKIPSFIGVTTRAAVDEETSVSGSVVVAESAASAATSAKFYVIGNKGGIKYNAFLLI
jgi:hypothetical protein